MMGLRRSPRIRGTTKDTGNVNDKVIQKNVK